MSPMNDKQLEQIRRGRVGQIKKAAIIVFAQFGFEGTKMSQIAEVAGISNGLFYRYFKSKDELYSILIKELLETANVQLSGISHLPGTPKEQIRMLTNHMLDENGKYSFMLIHQARTIEKIPNEAKQIIEQYSSNTLIDLLVPIFMKGQEMGEFRAGNPRQLLTWYFHIVNCIIISEHKYQEYGLPNVETIMRTITLV